MKIIRSILLAMLVVAITIGTLWHKNRPDEPKEATWEDVLVEAENGGYRIMSNTKLWELFKSKPSDLLLVDTRQEWEYRTGHIKGALNFPMEPTGWSRWRKQKPLANFLGPDKERLIVFY
jgi:3-mercaptopyruvate sulfurtransferase SseA